MLRSFWRWFGALFLVVVSLLPPIACTWQLILAMQVAAWPTTRGALLDVSLEEVPSRSGSTHLVKVQYDYEVSGVPYRGTRIAFGYSGGGLDQAERLAEKLRQGKSVAVFYDRAEPADSFLSAEASASYAVFVAGIWWMVMGFAFLWSYQLGHQDDPSLLANLHIQEESK